LLDLQVRFTAGLEAVSNDGARRAKQKVVLGLLGRRGWGELVDSRPHKDGARTGSTTRCHALLRR
jgi:hypothetical protein